MKAECGETLFFAITYEFLETFLPRQAGRSPCTVKSYREALTLFRRYVLEVLGMSIAEFTFAKCNRECLLGFMEYLSASGCAPSTRNQRLAALKSYLWFAADKDVTLQSISLTACRVPQCKAPDPERKVLSEKAATAILSQPADTRMGLRDRTIMVLLYDTAIRLAEILNLRLGDLMLDVDEPYIRVMGKGGKERIIAVSEPAVEHLRQYITFYRDADHPCTDLLFYTIIKGVAGKMSGGNVERFMQQYADMARESCPDVPHRVYPHMFRRTRATHMYQDGVDIRLISRILGHVYLDTTKTYAIPSLGMMRKAMESSVPPQAKDEKPLWIGSEDEMARKCGLR